MIAVYTIENNSIFFKTWISDLSTINTRVVTDQVDVIEVVIKDNNVYFQGFSSQLGKELWKSDISFNNLNLVLNINKSHFGANFYPNPNIAGNRILFILNDGIHGSEPWTYDKSEQKVYLVKDIYEGNKSSSLDNMVSLNNQVFFSATTNDYGKELWKSDGTKQGTVMVSDLIPGPGSSSPRNFIVHNGNVFFTIYKNNHYFLCKTDGNNTAIVKDLGVNEYNSPLFITHIVSASNLLYFSVAGQGEDLWKSDGTEIGTVKVKDLYNIDHLTSINNKVYFTASDTYNGLSELWQSDGTEAGTTLVKDIGVGYSSSPDDFTVFNGQLVFTAYTHESGREFWKSDGTAEGTIQIADINPGTAGSATTTSYAVLDGYLYFVANDGIHGLELWKTDGTSANTKLVRDINEGVEGAFPESLTSHANQLFFRAYSKDKGAELWVSEGTKETTKNLFDI